MRNLKFATLLLLTVSALPVLAHVKLESSTPARNSTVAASPEKVVLVFDEAVELKGLTVARAGDKAVTKLGPLPAQAAEQLAVPLPRLAAGDYVISFTFIGSDQHEMTSTIAFKVSGTPAAHDHQH